MKRGILLGAAVLLALAVLYGAVRFPKLQRLGEVGASYVAKNVCACVFVIGRGVEACRADMLPSKAQIRVEPLEAGIRASIPLLAERTAHHTPGRGCTLD